MSPKWPFGGSENTDDTQEQTPPTMTDSAANNNDPVLTFEGKRYDLRTLPDELKELVRGMQVADAQLRMHEDTLKVLALGRQTLAMQLKEKLKGVDPLPDAE
jgi:hypothetical protein|tara:strand:+ start:90 stop:395 length:306 start_codon:yes stop_codon:yes gene_type:complete